MESLTLGPAYGRDYTSRKAALADFEAGKDFVVWPSGQYTTRGELLSMLGPRLVRIRYDRLRKVFITNTAIGTELDR